MQILAGLHATFANVTLRQQVIMFKQAKIIFGANLSFSAYIHSPISCNTAGPHGAGLTNMMWSKDGTSVIEFPLTPFAIRTFGMLASICNHDYWILPEITCDYYQKYTADTENIDALIKLLKHIISKRGLDYLLFGSTNTEL